MRNIRIVKEIEIIKEVIRVDININNNTTQNVCLYINLLFTLIQHILINIKS